MRLLDSLRPLFAGPAAVHGIRIVGGGGRRGAPGSQTELDFFPLNPGVLALSPLKDNVLMPDVLAGAVREMAPRNGKSKRRDVAVILPDYSVRVAVLDFDTLPSDPKEQLSLIRFRVRKSVPFDVETAAISYHQQPVRVRSSMWW